MLAQCRTSSKSSFFFLASLYKTVQFLSYQFFKNKNSKICNVALPVEANHNLRPVKAAWSVNTTVALQSSSAKPVQYFHLPGMLSLDRSTLEMRLIHSGVQWEKQLLFLWQQSKNRSTLVGMTRAHMGNHTLRRSCWVVEHSADCDQLFCCVGACVRWLPVMCFCQTAGISFF